MALKRRYVRTLFPDTSLMGVFRALKVAPFGRAAQVPGISAYLGSLKGALCGRYGGNTSHWSYLGSFDARFPDPISRY